MKYLSKAQAALEQASSLINGPRQEAYGSPSENFDRLAVRISQILKVPITKRQAAQIMVELKLARLAHGYHYDSVVDAIAYLALMMELNDEPA
jgi:hypothetical protein